MEDYIYILAGAAYLAYSIYSASQKKKKKLEQAQQQSYAEDETEATEPDLNKEPASSSVFDQIMGLQKLELNVEEELFEQVEEELYAKVEEDVLDVVPKEEGVRTTDLSPSIEIKKGPEEVPIELEEETWDYEFDLRDAVISSEILNPPYISR